MAYDIIGDIHGQHGALTRLLTELGYRPDPDASWAHPTRKAVFVGDFIDRGPENLRVVDTVRRMVAAGTAHAVMGNHELNAIGYHTPVTGKPGAHLRPHSDKNRRQHQAFLTEAERDPESAERAIAWFRTLPLWLDLDGIRVAHACWHPRSFAALGQADAKIGRLTDNLFVSAFTPGTPEFEAIEIVLKGPEITLPDGVTFSDKEGNVRRQLRIKWWLDGARGLREAALMPEAGRELLPDGRLEARVFADFPLPDTPVFVGHYWFRTPCAPAHPRVACVDYSAGNGGDLCAYRWDGETSLRADRFVGVPSAKND